MLGKPGWPSTPAGLPDEFQLFRPGRAPQQSGRCLLDLNHRAPLHTQFTGSSRRCCTIPGRLDSLPRDFRWLRRPGWKQGRPRRQLTISRSTLTRRFRAVTGAAPADYLTRWRMDPAAIRLRDTDDTLDAIARSVGYTSVYSFSRAFRRALLVESWRLR
ncbi:helix-turn-helix transcriptional regulator [Nocardia sp. NPDC019395]|uniref:helix-turn-helix transcriptional regulator n=1 Tax=Nocardia sp. NPDC019395 TaxID=3154686 RepID=UPI003402A8E1